MITLIAACSNDWTIGKDNKIPWKCSEDLKRFKELTLGKTLLMGSKTYYSLPEPKLPGRKLWVVSSDPNTIIDVASNGYEPFTSMALAKSAAIASSEDIIIAGGESVYGQCISIVDEIDLTLIHADVSGDTKFHPSWLDGFERTEIISTNGPLGRTIMKFRRPKHTDDQLYYY